MNQPFATSRAQSPLKSEQAMTQIIAHATGRTVNEVAQLLRREYNSPGVTVAEAFAERGLERYVFSEGLARFYSESDAFIFESTVWNANRIKREMRRWIGRQLDQISKSRGQKLNVLCIGDGLGFDSAHFAKRGHDVTYHEVPGPHETVARSVFEHEQCDVTIINDSSDIEAGSFDVLVCLDVLEHVPDPGAFIETLLGHLKPDGLFIVHAPFYMIHPAYPTHLKTNRRYSGDLKLYTQHGLTLINGRAFWNPLVFARGDNHARPPLLTRAAISMAGLYLAAGRSSGLPMRPVHWYRHAMRKWFR